jgi:hypothetical protein
LVSYTRETEPAIPPTLSKTSAAAPAALFYSTVGALMTVWSALWFF